MHKPVFDTGLQKDGSYNFDSIFKYISSYVTDADFAVVNLETTFAGTDNGYSYAGYPHFNCPDALADATKNAGFDLLLTANNHSFTCGVALHMGTGTLTLEKAEKPFFFSAIPYTPAQLEQAQHVWELPGHCRTTVTVASDMRGVGGIDSWGTDVESAYRVSGEEDHCLRFRVML